MLQSGHPSPHWGSLRISAIDSPLCSLSVLTSWASKSNMSRKFLAACTAPALLLLPPAAVAQTSQCQWVGSIWTCQQQQRSGVDWGAAIRSQQQQQQSLNWEALARQRAQNEQAQGQQNAAALDERQRNLRAEVGQMVADGRCDDAKKAALQAGEFELAERAMKLCTPAGAED